MVEITRNRKLWGVFSGINRIHRKQTVMKGAWHFTKHWAADRDVAVLMLVFIWRRWKLIPTLVHSMEEASRRFTWVQETGTDITSTKLGSSCLASEIGSLKSSYFTRHRFYSFVLPYGWTSMVETFPCDGEEDLWPCFIGERRTPWEKCLYGHEMHLFENEVCGFLTTVERRKIDAFKTSSCKVDCRVNSFLRC